MSGLSTPPHESIPVYSTYDLSSYRYFARSNESDDTTATEWGIVDYTQGNMEYILGLFDNPDKSFSYYNVNLQGFIPQELHAYSLPEAKNNYELDFVYNYYDSNFESLDSTVPLSALPNHYCIKQNNSIMSLIGSWSTGPITTPEFLYGDDVNEEASYSLSTLAGSLSSYKYDLEVYQDQGFDFAYSPDNYYNLHNRFFRDYMESDDYRDFKFKTMNCYMSFKNQAETSTAPYYSHMRINFNVPQFGSQGTIEKEWYQGSREYIYYFYNHITSNEPETKNLSSLTRGYSVQGTLAVEQSIDQVDVKLYEGMSVANVPLDIEEKLMSSREITLFDEGHFANNIFHTFTWGWPSMIAARWYRKVLDWDVYRPGFGNYIDKTDTYRPVITCFKIDKFEGTSTVPLQTYYMNYSADMEYNFVELLDTQLFYGKNYRYKVSAICRLNTPIVKIKNMFYSDDNGNLHAIYINSNRVAPQPNLGVGNLSVSSPVVSDFLDNYFGLVGVSGYSVVNIGSQPRAQQGGPAQQAGTLELSEISNHPFLKPNNIYMTTEISQKVEFMEVDMFEDSFDVVEPIFVSPEVKFYNKNGRPNDVLVKAELNYNSNRVPYIPITPDDLVKIEPYLQYFDNNGNYNFRTMNGEGKFELRRLSSPPDSYSDFANAAVQTFTAGPASPARYSVLAYAINKIKPNKKYYYILRAMNNHGVYSNPTSVFELELLQDSDDTFIIVNEYEFKNNLTNNYSKSGRRYLQIKVSNLQGLINEQVSQFEDATSASEITSVQLGPEDIEDSVWGKTFKIRLTSEKTGKKIDFNISFKHTDEPS